jgi:DNA polymerase-3 subunit alpha
MTDFVHLHVHSDFSLLDASASVMALADKAGRMRMSHLALTDPGRLFGAKEFMAACEETLAGKDNHQKRKNPDRPIIGCEVYVSPGSRHDKKGAENDNRFYHLVLLAANREGYFNLVRLCSYAYIEGFYYRPRIDEELLAQYHGGLVALSACASGEIPRLIQAGDIAGAEQKALCYRDLFGEDEKGNPNFYLEIQDHGIPSGVLRGGLSQAGINRAVIDIAGRTGIPLVATNDVHYLDREDREAHDILLCIGTAQVRTEERRKKKYYGDQFYLKSGDEMAALFPDYPEAIANTVRIAERCVADVPKMAMKDLLGFLPDFDIPPGYENGEAYLRRLASDGLARRYPKEKAEGGEGWRKVKERFDYELDVIIRMGFTGYFLIVADFINWAKEHGIPVAPGRGSGVASIVAYSLRITNVEPLKYNLLFERFLNTERISMPDFDVDFANEGRDEVIKYVTEKYGRDRVGQIITFGTLGAKQAIKDVARSLGISIPESDMITKLIPKDPRITLPKALEDEPKLRELAESPKYGELFVLAGKLEGLHRHSSIHAAGLVIGKSPLIDLLPLYRDPKTGIIATQYSMGYLEDCGLIKMDFLGLKTLDVIKHTEELIRERGGAYAGFSVEEVSETDEATFKMLSEGKSFEVFQFESDGMQNVLKRAKPGAIEDLFALNSLYRPGPMDNIDRFIDSKNGRQVISYPDPSLENILKETYGVIVYQEQVMQVAQTIAGYTLGQADMLRRAMGKKKKEILDKEKIPFLEGAVKRGYDKDKASEIYDILIPFAGYGFNKSHAAAYSVTAYHTAYLKANFPAEFMAANLTNEIHSQDKDKLSECISEARKMGLAIDPPDINRSQKLFTVVEGRIVYGLLGIKGLGDGPADEIVRHRRDGPYRDFMDFLSRADIKAVGKGVIERLIQTGAFDRFGVARETLFGSLERAVEYAQNIKDEKKFGQASLFGDTGEKEYPDFEYESFPELGRAERLRIEKELIGFYFSGHPLDEYRDLLERVEKSGLGGQFLIGIVKNIKVITTNKGGKMAFAMLENYDSETELTFFSSAWEKCQGKAAADKVAILKGKAEYQADRDKHSFIVDECLEADDAESALKEAEAQARKWDKYRNVLKYAPELDMQLLDLKDPGAARPGTYTVIGTVRSLKTHIDKKGKEMAFGTLQDRRGEIDLLFFARTWENCKALVTVDEIIALRGTIDPQQDKNPRKPGFMVSSVQDLNRLIRSAAKKAAEHGGSAETPASGGIDDESGEALPNETVTAGADISAIAVANAETAAPFRKLHIRLAASAANNDGGLDSLRNCLEGNPGACPVYIHVPASSQAGSGPAGSGQKETVIRAGGSVGSGVSFSELTKYAVVTDVWGED